MTQMIALVTQSAAFIHSSTSTTVASSGVGHLAVEVDADEMDDDPSQLVVVAEPPVGEVAVGVLELQAEATVVVTTEKMPVGDETLVVIVHDNQPQTPADQVFHSASRSAM